MASQQPPPPMLKKTSLMDSYRLDPNDTTLFEPKPAAVKRKVCLAISLLVIGSVLLSLGIVFFLQGTEGCLSMIIVGSLAFIPGFYFTRIAYMAYKGAEGFSLSDIPEV